MEISGSYRFAAPPERVWNLLMDPTAIAGCLPGCQSLDAVGDDRYHARLTVALAAITGTYEGTVAITDKIPNTSYRLAVEGQGKPGFVNGNATMTLRADDGGTVVDVAGTLEAGGAIARVGQRLIASVGRMMQHRFFNCLQSKI